MQPDSRPAARAPAGGPRACALALLPLLLMACAAPARAPARASQPAPVVAAAPAPEPVPVTVVPAVVAPAPGAVETMLEYAERVRALPAPELQQEIGRLGDPQDAAPRLLQLSLAVAATRTPGSAARAQSLVQRVLAQSHQEARTLHPLARLLSAQYADARKMEEQLERQTQQARDAQRKVDQLNDRLEAVRAIERSLPTPAPGASVAVPGGGLRQ